MLTSDFTFNPDMLVTIAIRMVIILVLALVLTHSEEANPEDNNRAYPKD